MGKAMWMLAVALLVLFHGSIITFCWSLNPQGMALMRFKERVEKDPFGALSNWSEAGEDDDDDDDPCSWFGVGCSDLGDIVSLHLKDLCLEGTLAPELERLPHLKSIILRNNSFSGNIPKEIAELKELEELDLGYNNFSGTFPFQFAYNFSLTTLLLDNNKFLRNISPELHSLAVLSELHAHENQLGASCNIKDITWNFGQLSGSAHRALLKIADAPKTDEHQNSPVPSPSPSPLLAPSASPLSMPPSISVPPSPSPTEAPTSLHLPPSPAPEAAPPVENPPTNASAPPPVVNPPTNASAPPQHEGVPVAVPSSHIAKGSHKSNRHIVVIASVSGASFFLLVSLIATLLFRSSKVVSVRPWTTGLSGQLQKAFVTGVPKLQRSELEAACEDFSNIIGYFSEGTVYKGTLSSGVEIAVTSSAVASSKDWSKNLESQFRKKIDTLSKVNHKNFVNLIGFCEEDIRFTRMMVFEYAPNGTLFEHLHIKEAEHLDWPMRLRIAMGMAYCLEHMHQLNPPFAHKNLQSSSVYLTEDYAAKISDFCICTEVEMGMPAAKLPDSPLADLASNVYSFGVILFEMMTGRMPYAAENGSLQDWATDYLSGSHSLREMLDPTLQSFQESELKKLSEVIKACTHPDPKQRPKMREVAAELKEITAMGPDSVTPKLSPLWWAELEILSTEGS